VTDLLAARIPMTLSLAIPLLMVRAEWGWRRRSDANGTAILFAVGTASGTLHSSLRLRQWLWTCQTGQRGSQLILGR